MSWEEAVQILTACLGSLGFGMIFHTEKKKLIIAGISGGLTWGLYLLCGMFTDRIFLANLIASFFAAAFAESMAHLFKAPATIFTISAVVPLVPGGTLYYTMRAIVENRQADVVSYGVLTGLTAGALAFGLLLFTGVYHLVCRLWPGEKRKRAI